MSGYLYLTFKWLHIIAIISWMAGILYIFRIFIYQVERGLSNSDNHDLLTMMGSKLYRIITVPAMAASYLLGFGIIATIPSYLHTGWFAIKFLFVLGLTAVTIYAGKLQRRLAAKEGPFPTSKQLRLMNEVPTVLMILIVGMVIFKPW